MPSPELCTEEEVTRLVHGFYANVRQDAVLGPVFDEHVRDWDRHLPTMVDFWSGALRGTARFRGAPMPKHAALPGLSDGGHGEGDGHANGSQGKIAKGTAEMGAAHRGDLLCSIKRMVLARSGRPEAVASMWDEARSSTAVAGSGGRAPCAQSTQNRGLSHISQPTGPGRDSSRPSPGRRGSRPRRGGGHRG